MYNVRYLDLLEEFHHRFLEAPKGVTFVSVERWIICVVQPTPHQYSTYCKRNSVMLIVQLAAAWFKKLTVQLFRLLNNNSDILCETAE